MADKIFGTDGIREIVGKYPLVPFVVEEIVRFFSDNNFKRILVGFDTRESSPKIACHFLKMCSIYSIDCVSAGYTSTPMLSFLTKKMDFEMGIMITASHNPYRYNGLKFFNGSGEKVDRDFEKIMEKSLKLKKSEREYFRECKDLKFLFERSPDFKALYYQYLGETFLQNLKNFFEKKVVYFDCANGSLSTIIGDLFGEKYRTRIFFSGFDGKNINEGCGATHPDVICGKIREDDVDFGVAFDGDGDRVVVCDGERIYSGDELLYIFATYLKEKGRLKNDLVCGTILSGLGLEISLKRKGISLLRSDVGDRNVYYLMKERDGVLGGEESGHIILREFLPTGDGLASFLFLCEILNETDLKISDLLDGYEKSSTVKFNISYKLKKDVNRIYGVGELKNFLKSVFGNDFRLIVRYSGTEPFLRIVVEAKGVDEVAKDIQLFVQKIYGELN